MDFLRKLLDVTRNQSFFCSLLLLNLPNLFFMVPCLAKDNISLASVLGCIGCYVTPSYLIALFLVRPKERWRKLALWVSAALAVIDMGSMVLMHQPFYFSYLPSILGTNAREAKEFLEVHLTFHPETALMLLVCIPLLKTSIRDRIFHWYQKFYDRDYTTVVLVTVLLALSYLYGISSHLLTTRMPLGNSILRVSLDGLRYASQNRNLEAATPDDIPSVVSYDDSIPYVVVVLGESANKHHIGVYGYDLPTSPWAEEQEQEGNLAVYRQTLASRHYTIAALGDIFSERTKDDKGNYFHYPNIFQMLSQTSYHTSWISNQENVGVIGSFEKNLTRDVQSVTFTRAAVANMDADLVYDDVILPAMEETLQQNAEEKNQFLVLHLMGSHQWAKNRYPQDFAKFQPEDEDGENDEQKKNRAEYDNSILYTDHILDEVTKRFADKDAVVIYFSDHGEDVYDEEKKFFAGHGSEGRDEELYIPFFVWGSKSFQKNHVDLWKNIQSAKDKPFRTDSFPAYLKALLSIQTS